MAATARDISVTDFDYTLPDERIARYPTADRHGAKQLVFSAADGSIETHPFRSLAERLAPGTLMVGNQTRVIHARILFPMPAGKRPIEIFCLDPLQPADHAQNLGALTQVQWKCLIGGNRRWKRGPLTIAIPLGAHRASLTAERMGSHGGGPFEVAFTWECDQADVTFGEILEAAGTLPLPPYLGRATETADEDRYQTVFAREDGSVAAPTAGLHFSPEVMAGLAAAGIDWEMVTLHVGAGTFRPVKSPTLRGHDMHKETFYVSKGLVDRLVAQHAEGRPVVSVGTTSLRCLESLHCLGAELALGRRDASHRGFRVGQWAFEDQAVRELPALSSLTALQKMMTSRGLPGLAGETEVLLSPVSGIRVVDGLITNFHQPKSTLLLLIAAITGPRWRDVYRYALENDYRFLSYGDSSLLWR